MEMDFVGTPVSPLDPGFGPICMSPSNLTVELIMISPADE